MGLIHIEQMEFYAFHGHFREEQIVGNRFLIDLDLETDLSHPAQTDRLDDAVDYQQAYQVVQKAMEEKSYLLENIGKRILHALFLEMKGITGARVKIRKMNPPMGGPIGSVGITMYRSERDYLEEVSGNY